MGFELYLSICIMLDFSKGKVGGLEFQLDLDAEEVQYAIHYYYADADRVFAKSDKGLNIALSIYTDSIADFEALSNHVGWTYLTEGFKEDIVKEFTDIFKSDSFVLGEAQWLYQVAPPFVLQTLGDDFLLAHLKQLLSGDKGSWFWDAGPAMVNILMGFNDLKKLYNLFYDDPKFTKDIYKYINEDSGENSRETYCNFLTVLCLIYQEIEDIDKLDTVYVGGDYELNSDLFWDTPNKVFIENYYDYTKEVPTTANYGNGYQKKKYVSKRHYHLQKKYHPLDMVILADKETGQMSIVPAIFVKRLSDIAEWNQIMNVLMIIVTIISMLTSVGILLRGAVGLIRVMAVADLIIGSIDLLLANEKFRETLKNSGPAGKWFVENWPIISLMSSMGIMSIQMAKGFIKHADSLVNFFNKAEKFDIADQIKKMWKHAQETIEQGVKGQGLGDATKSFFKNLGVKTEEVAGAGKILGQTTDYTCVASSTRMILDDFGKELSEDYVANAVKTVKPTATNPGGARVLDIGDGLYGMRLERFHQVTRGLANDSKATMKELITQLKKNGRKAVVSVYDETFKGHAIVVDKIENGRVFVRDPLPINVGSSYSVAIEDFEQVFNRKFVILKK